jgi:carbonic anhydrase
MKEIEQLFANNRRWAEGMTRQDPGFFAKLSRQQAPPYLWIGCADSRVPANEIVGLLPGELFVHRNVANIVLHADVNCLSVLQYAVEVLQVRHVIVCGHYGCGGVAHAMGHGELGLIDNWLRCVKDLYERHRAELETLDPVERLRRLCELNVAQQVRNVAHTTIVQGAWLAGRSLAVHGWIYDIADGLLHDLEVTISGPEQLEPIYRIERRSA